MNKANKPRHVRITYEPNRQAPLRLAQAYETVCPATTRPLNTPDDTKVPAKAQPTKECRK